MKLNTDEKRQLSAILGCTVKDLSQVVQSYGEAAEEEYVRMILGQKVFTRGSDIREYRLLLLIQYVFKSRLPTEQQICDLFQTSTTQGRALLRSVLSKYQYELHDVLNASLRQLLTDAVPIDGRDEHMITVDSECEIDALNRRLLSLDGTLPQVTKSKGLVGSYEIKKSAFDELSKALGI